MKLFGRGKDTPDTTPTTFLRHPDKPISAADDAILSRHYDLSEEIRLNYPKRADPAIMAKVITDCEQQIAIAPKAAKAYIRNYNPVNIGSDLPAHVGFTQLAIIREKQGNVDEAIRLSRLALKQRWPGDWEKRIARLEARKMKAG